MAKELCIDVRMATCSGIGTYIRNLVTRLQNGPFKLRLIADPKTLEEWPSLAHFDLILCKAPYYSIQEQLQLPLLIPSSDLFWSPHYNIPLLPLRAKKRIVTIHDVYHLAYQSTLSLPKRIYAKAMISQAARRSDAIITVSRFSQSEIVKYVAPLPIHVIPLGVDRTLFIPSEDKAALDSVKKKYNLPEKFLLFVSNLAPHKNVQGLLQALTHLKEPIALIIVGKKTGATPEYPKSEARFLGPVDAQDLSLLYQLAYATVHPSFYEGFGLTPLEAMSSGSPVIVSNVASLPEICEDAAIYVDPHDPKEIAQGIEKLAPIREEMRLRGMARAKMFSWDLCASEHIKLLDSL